MVKDVVNYFSERQTRAIRAKVYCEVVLIFYYNFFKFN